MKAACSSYFTHSMAATTGDYPCPLAIATHFTFRAHVEYAYSNRTSPYVLR